MNRPFFVVSRASEAKGKNRARSATEAFLYGLRWHAEDAKRFLGQIWHVERFLVPSFRALERLPWCVVAAGGFQPFLQREEPRLAGELDQQVLYWDKPAVIPGYRLARGLPSVAQQTGHVPVLNNA